MRRSFLERTVDSLRDIADQSLFAEETARREGFLQRVDPRAKLAGFLALIVAVTLARDLVVITTLFAAALMLAAYSNLGAMRLLSRVWVITLFFAGVAILPALVVTPGDTALSLPFGLEVTWQGLRSATRLLARVETATTLSVVLVLSTRWSALLGALRSLRVPLLFVVIVGMTYRYIFLLLQIAGELFEARRSRRCGMLTGAQQRRIAVATAGALMTRSLRLSEEIYLAMQSRGFRGEVRVLDAPRMRAADWLVLSAFLLVAAAATIAGR